MNASDTLVNQINVDMQSAMSHAQTTCAQRLYLRPIKCIALSAPRRTTHAYTAQDRPVDMATLATARSPCSEPNVAAHEATTSCKAFTAQDFDAHGNNNASVSASDPLMKHLNADM